MQNNYISFKFLYPEYIKDFKIFFVFVFGFCICIWILMYTDFKTNYLVGQGSQDGIQTVTKESNSAIYV